MAGAKLTKLRKSFGALDVLKGIDLAIAPGDFTVFLGPSGCGKSTTLRILAGLETQTSGDVFIGDRNVSALEPRERDIAMVFQNYALYPNMTIAQNLGFGLKARKTPKADIEARVDHAARMLGITELLARKPRQLSGGQQQRVAIGRAIVREPQLFLFDEPLSNLDAKLRVEMRTELMQLHRQLGATTVYVTHDQEEAMTMADRIVVMNEGAIEQVGPPADIYFAPVSRMVAGFVGSPAMNMVDGTIAASGIDTPLGPIAATVRNAAPGTKVVVGMRPDDLDLPDRVAQSDRAGLITFDVTLIELLGARGIVGLRHGAIACKGVFDERDLARFSEGAPVDLALPADRLHIFDADSGRRLVA